jgi:ABC-type transporter Mla subunit MlaD
MANKKIEIDIIINSAQSAKTVGELKNSLQQIKSTLNEIGDEGTDDFNRLNNALTEVSGKLSNVGSAAGSAVNPLDKLKTTAERFDGISKSLAGGVSLAAGAFGLLKWLQQLQYQMV